LPDPIRLGHEWMDLSAVRAGAERSVRCVCGKAVRQLQRSIGAVHVSLFDHVPFPHICGAARRSLLARGVGALPGTSNMDNVRTESHQENLVLTTEVPVIEASDIQATVLRPRPKPYRGEYVILRVDDAGQGREMVQRILPHVAPADEWWGPSL